MPAPAGPKIATEEIFAFALGVSAAVLLVGSSFFLRWQRNRQRFELTRLALENGGTNFPKGPPYWLVSLREAVTTIALGIGLLAAGGLSYYLGSREPPPTQSELRAAADEIGAQQRAQHPPMRERFGPDGPGEEGLPPEMQGPPQQRGMQNQQPEARPPVPIPALDKYRRAQAMQTIGLLALGCGAVLTFLGIIRAGFARVERKHDPSVE